MTDYSQRLKHLDDKKLMDVVKNYRQYGYNISIRAKAISILGERGFSEETLELTGNMYNKTYDYAETLYSSFKRNSKVAFILFSLLLITNISTSIFVVSANYLTSVSVSINAIATILYLLFLIKSFLNQNKFYKVTNDDYGTEGVLMYFLLGMPLYIVMYFYFGNQMKEKMKDIQ